MDSRPEPSLPSDLERPIFELCAISRPVSIPKLMLVAWRVKEWVEPWLYRTITLDLHGPARIDGYPIFTQSTLLQVVGRNPMCLRSSVRHLYLQLYPTLGHRVTKNESIPNILVHLPTLENLTLGAQFGEIKTQSDLTTMKLIADMHLKRFCGDFIPLLDFPLTAPFFSRITHLGLARVSITTSPTAALCERLARIPSLTHLAFDDPNIIPECRELLQHCKSLRVLVLFELGLGEQRWCQEYIALLSHDPRFLAMEESWYVEDWHFGVREGLDFWARAEDFIARRRTGEINLLQYEILHASVEEEEEEGCTGDI
ncbi:hypothetical protein C8F04DRAFT_1116312 [Mycena alexandri]|uniref:Uncharacterized protein n=1 Tax=Mycena alexandri TaxID=1745969 RepID=A0AAD6S501_9AGAR|nr:hypothetical protein C8F04DRAFT_1242236 [Mycena alexandri]KAJ7029609.1 hypothetical protein C8F04DRAFT_1116312 [Mycena alexandri]